MKRWLGLGSTSNDAVAFTEFGWQPVKPAQVLDKGKVSAPCGMETATAISYKREGHLVMREAQKWVAPNIANSQLTFNRKSDKASIQELSRQQGAAIRSFFH